MRAEASTSRVVSAARASADPGAPGRPRLVVVPNLRTGARGHYHRSAEPLPRQAPASNGSVSPPVAPSPSIDLRWLCCEGACSPAITAFAKEQRELYRVGYALDNLRASETAALNHTPHYFVRVNQLAHTLYQMWACAKCGNERVYGAEEA